MYISVRHTFQIFFLRFDKKNLILDLHQIKITSNFMYKTRNTHLLCMIWVSHKTTIKTISQQ